MTFQSTAELTYYTLGEVAAILRVSVSTMRRWQEEGIAPPGIKINGQWRFEHSAFAAWIDAHGSGPLTPEDTIPARET